jgi:hypothetical protein
MLIRLLTKSPNWEKQIQSYLSNYFYQLCHDSFSHTKPNSRQYFSTMAVLGGFTEIFRPGGRVQDGDKMGTIVKYDRMQNKLRVIFDGESKITNANASNVAILDEIAPNTLNINLTKELLDGIVKYLVMKDKIPQEDYYYCTTLRTMIIKVLYQLLQSPEAVQLYLESQKAGTAPSLVDLAISLGPVKPSILKMLEYQQMRLMQRMYEISVHPSEIPRSQHQKTANSSQNFKNFASLKDLIPYNPWSNIQDVKLPTKFDLKSKDLHHIIPISDTEVEFYGKDTDDLIIAGNATIPTSLDHFYFEARFVIRCIENI